MKRDAVHDRALSTQPAAERAAAATDLMTDMVPAGVDTARLVSWSDRLVASSAPGVFSLAVRLTDTRTMRALNRRYRGEDSPTDVLSFPGQTSPEGRHLGDIVIAVPVASRQADEAGHSLEIEIKTLILHGVLHCLGHDHESDDGEMEALEAELRRAWVTVDE